MSFRRGSAIKSTFDRPGSDIGCRRIKATGRLMRGDKGNTSRILSEMPRRRSIGRLWMFSLAGILGACAYFPDDGPSAHRVLGSASNPAGTMHYTIVDLDTATADRIAAYYSARQPEPAWETLPPGRTPGAVAPGDVLDITLWDANEAQPAEEMSPGSMGTGQEKDFEVIVGVDGAGTIAVPFAGRWRVAGKVPSAIESDLILRLHNKFVAAQASVLVKENISNTAFFEGDVLHPGRVEIPPGGMRLLDGLALAGGSKNADQDAALTIAREGHSATWPLCETTEMPAANVPLAPGDTVTLSYRPNHFYAFGAVNHPGIQNLESANNHLGEIVGEMGGLQDVTANPGGFFIFRYEPRGLLDALGTASVASADDVPVVYRLDMRRPQSYFVLDRFPMQAGDVLYVANAPIAELGKFIELVSGFGSTIQTGKNVGFAKN